MNKITGLIAAILFTVCVSLIIEVYELKTELVNKDIQILDYLNKTLEAKYKPTYDTINVKTTFFQPTRKQCGRFFYITSNGDSIFKKKDGSLGWIGLTHDLFKKYNLKYNDTVLLQSQFASGYYIVKTKTSSKLTNRVDILIETDATSKLLIKKK